MHSIIANIKSQLKSLLREYVVTKKEEKLIAFGAVLYDTAECFDGYQGDVLSDSPLPGGRYCLSDIYVRYGAYTFGFIQRIQFDKECGIAYIGHIATKQEYMGLGLARRFIYAFAACAKVDYGVREIHFCESAAKDEKLDLYDKFFTQKLGATRLPHNFGDVWVWQIPEGLSEDSSFFKRKHQNAYIDLYERQRVMV